eukprot:gnl/TRDRNA2_/TRDRNA2_169962_c1_seq3.p1 gnl/TRDRNA2_/TRDRNA2_169962_c1~~gnl/TRDRNA2_/TRDRNA2_169962_c1_seq3.p1  ORF type:complete len:256 (+),score=13.71 gnl/TRDRNA2_/TRDRNA2_169962_c1_seq3:123-890(+)
MLFDSVMPRMTAACAVAYLASVLNMGLDHNFCMKQVNLYQSLWYNRLPSAVILHYSNLLMLAANPRFTAMSRVLLTAAAVLIAFVGTPLLENLSVWGWLGLPNCGALAGVGKQGDLRHVFAGLPFQLSILFFSHLPGKPPVATGTLLRFLSRVCLPLQFGHRLVFAAMCTRFPIWGAEYRRPKGLFEQQLLYVVPLLLLNILLAVVVNELVAEPWTALAECVAMRLPRVVVFWAFSYVGLCILVWNGLLPMTSLT